MDEKVIEVRKETIKIEGDRNLYKYTFPNMPPPEPPAPKRA